MFKQLRDKAIRLTLTRDELRLIKELAYMEGLDSSKYLRRLVMQDANKIGIKLPKSLQNRRNLHKRKGDVNY